MIFCRDKAHNFPLNIPKKDFLELYDVLNSIFNLYITKSKLNDMSEIQYKLFLIKRFKIHKIKNKNEYEELSIKTPLSKILELKIGYKQEQKILNIINGGD